MGEFLKQLMASKKVWATITAIIVWLVGRIGFHIEADDLLPVVGAIATFVLAQGWADHGKEAAKVQLQSERAPTNPS